MGKTARPPQLLSIIPNSELEFKGDPKDVNTTQIELRNETQNKIGFKVMTNAPQLLFVRPACEVIMPDSRSSISVMLQPHQHESGGLKQHKLLIQSIIVQPEDSHESIEQLFSNSANSHLVMETRLNCTFKELYTSEMVFPLSSEPEDHHDGGRANTSSPTEASTLKNKEQTAPPLNVTMVAILVAILVAIFSWVLYFKFVNTDDGDGEQSAEAVLA